MATVESMSTAPAITAILGLRRLPALRVVSLRHAAGSTFTPAAEAGRVVGDGPRWLWRSPTEQLWIGDDEAAAQSVIAAHAPGIDPLVVAVDQTAGVAAWSLERSAWQLLLPRLIDASAMPGAAGWGTRARLADVAVTLLRIDDNELWLLAAREVEGYLLAWLTHAHACALEG